MEIVVLAHQIELTPVLRAYVETRLARVGRNDEHPLHLQVRLSAEGQDYAAEATTSPIPGKVLHVEVRNRDIYAAIDLLAAKLDRLLIKHGIAAAHFRE